MKMNKIIEISKKFFNHFSKEQAAKKDQIVCNLNLDLTRRQERALVCYLDYQGASSMISRGVTHTNQPRFFQILKCLFELDMVVDVCACNDTDAIGEIDFQDYDYVMGFGKVFQAVCQTHCRAKKIIYMTEDPYYVAKRAEEDRIEYFLQRHNGKKYESELRKVSNTRAGFFYLPEQEKEADIIICQGNEEHFKGLNAKVYPIIPNAFRNDRFTNQQDKKVEKTFVMFGASGLVRKGVDILIEVFEKHPDWELILCDRDISSKLSALGYEKLPTNVHDYGFVDIESEDAIDLFNKCRFIILPSCTEAPSSAILTGMRHGLIPVVTSGIGLDKFSDYCFYFHDYHIENIESVLQEICRIPKETLNTKSRDIFEYANRNFTLEGFTRQFKLIMQDIITARR